MNGRIDTEIGNYLREVIAQHVQNDKETYNEAMLGRPNTEYCKLPIHLYICILHSLEVCIITMDIIN